MYLCRVGFVGVVVGGVKKVVVFLVAEFGFDLLLADVKGVGDIFQKDQTEDGVLIDGGVEVGAELVRWPSRAFCRGPLETVVVQPYDSSLTMVLRRNHKRLFFAVSTVPQSGGIRAAVKDADGFDFVFVVGDELTETGDQCFGSLPGFGIKTGGQQLVSREFVDHLMLGTQQDFAELRIV